MITAPAELATRPQWVAWRLELRDNRNTKVPYNARTGSRASSTDPHTWATFEEACRYCAAENASGVGYVLSPDDPYVGIDLDHCRDPHSGRIDQWAKDVVKRLNSYTEISPSGTGLRIFIRGVLPPHGRRKGPIEIYSQARFLTITGDHVLFAPDTIQDRAEELLKWHTEIFGSPPEPRQNGHVPRSPIQLADADLLLKARAATNGGAFWALWNGDYTAYGSQSEADLALLNHLAFWTGPDPSRLDQLFRASGLMREKWDRPDYRDRTVDKVLEGKTEFYGGPSTSPRLTIPTHTVDPVTGEVTSESPWRSLGELVRNAPESGVQLVEGFLWADRTTWVYSGPGAGKTLTWLALLMHVADETKDTFLGRKLVHGPVCVIEEDSPDSIISDYVQMLADIYDFDLDTLPFWINRVRGVRLTDDTGVQYARSLIDAAPLKPIVVMLDACERIVPSDRFNSKELEPLGRFLMDNLAKGITNVMIDHTRKPVGSNEPTDPIDTLYGGRPKSAISDVMMHFSGSIKNKAFITFPKFRGEEPAPITIDFDGAAGFTIKEGKPKISQSEQDVMRVLNNGFGKSFTKQELAKSAKLGDKTVQRALTKLIELGWVERKGTTSASAFAVSQKAPGMFG